MKTLHLLAITSVVLVSPIAAPGSDVFPGPANFFRENFSDFLKRRGVPPNVTFEVKTRDAVSARFSISTGTFNPRLAATSSTVVAFAVGNLSHSAALSEDPFWIPGKTFATFPITTTVTDPQTGEPKQKIIGRFSYTWTNNRINVTVIGNNIGSIVCEPYYGTTQVFNVPLDVTVDFESFHTTLRAFAKGEAKVVTKIRGTGDNEQEFTLNKVKAGIVPPPP